MHFLKTLPSLLLVGYACAAVTLERRKQSRGACIHLHAQNATDTSPFDTDVVICYHGDNTATGPSRSQGITNLSPPHYGYKDHFECPKAGIDCFWMRAPNTWVGKGDAGSDNIAMYINNRCTYDRSSITVTCK